MKLLCIWPTIYLPNNSDWIFKFTPQAPDMPEKQKEKYVQIALSRLKTTEKAYQ